MKKSKAVHLDQNAGPNVMAVSPLLQRYQIVSDKGTQNLQIAKVVATTLQLRVEGGHAATLKQGTLYPTVGVNVPKLLDLTLMSMEEGRVTILVRLTTVQS